MWTTDQLTALKHSIEMIKADSMSCLVDNCGDGELCKWLLDTFSQIGILHGNQSFEFNHETGERRDREHYTRAEKLPQGRFISFSLDVPTLLKRLGGRRFDFVVNAEPFGTLDEAIAWADLFAPRTTGKVFCIADGQVRSMPGTHEIPVRSEPVRHEWAVASVGDINDHVLYSSR